MWRRRVLLATMCVAPFCANVVIAEVPPELASPGETTIAIFHAEGAQVYECKAGGDGKLSWSFREPIATLLVGDKTVGRHYAGPTWELTDGSAIVGKVAATAPGATAEDIPWLKLDVASRRGNGTLSDTTTVQRINTHGGVSHGACDQAGAFRSVPYSADYSFLSKEDQDITSSIPKSGHSR
jgi:hypothetical protein